MKNLILFFTLFGFCPAFAQVVLAPTNFESAGVLPKGIRNVTLTGFFTEIYDKVDGNGNIDSVAAAFNKNVTWKDVLKGIESKKGAEASGKLRAFLQSNGLKEGDSVGETFGSGNVGVSVQAPVMAFGITKKWTIGVAVPIVTQDVRASHGFVASAGANGFANALHTDNRTAEAEKLVESFQTPVQNTVVSNGYKPVQSKKTTGIGDILIQNRFSVLTSKKINVLLVNTLVLPTGRKKNVDDLTDIGTGQGQWDVGLKGIADFKPFGDRYTFTASLGYMAQLALDGQFQTDRLRMRIPLERGVVLTPDVDSSVSRDVGDLIIASLGTSIKVAKGFTVSAALFSQYKYEDRYSGSVYERVRYENLQYGTETKMNSFALGFGYSTIPLFREKKFKLPLKAQLSYAKVLSARNTYDDDIYGFNFGIFF